MMAFDKAESLETYWNMWSFAEFDIGLSVVIKIIQLV